MSGSPKKYVDATDYLGVFSHTSAVFSNIFASKICSIIKQFVKNRHIVGMSHLIHNITRYLKLIEKVSFNIAIALGAFENLKLAVKQCY